MLCPIWPRDKGQFEILRCFFGHKWKPLRGSSHSGSDLGSDFFSFPTAFFFCPRQKLPWFFFFFSYSVSLSFPILNLQFPCFLIIAQISDLQLINTSKEVPKAEEKQGRSWCAQTRSLLSRSHGRGSPNQPMFTQPGAQPRSAKSYKN
jgi:hypothetical protein